jgi:hypothetical protein
MPARWQRGRSIAFRLQRIAERSTDTTGGTCHALHEISGDGGGRSDGNNAMERMRTTRETARLHGTAGYRHFSSGRKPMSTAMNMTKQAIHDKIESQIRTAQAKLETLKAKAESARANAELKSIADLLTKKRAIDQKLTELKQSGETTYQQAKTDVESRVAELEKSVQAIEAKFKAA